MLARNAGGWWIAVGTGIGTLAGVALGYASVGLAVGVGIGVLAALVVRDPRQAAMRRRWRCR